MRTTTIFLLASAAIMVSPTWATSPLSVQVITANVDLGEVGLGVFPAHLRFRVDANVEQVKFKAVCTALYRDGDPASQYVIAVENHSAGDGAVVQPTNANPTQGQSSVLGWSEPVELNGMSAMESERREYESGQAARFNQDVEVVLAYHQGDPELPIGEYSGWVKIVCEVEGGITATAEAHVYIDVVSIIAVGVVTSNVDLGNVQIGPFPGQVIFRIDANVEQVSMTVTASNLYKGGVPGSLNYIRVRTGTANDGALVEPDEGNAADGHGNLLAWLPGVVALNGMNGVASETWAFESGQSGHFSQNVTVSLEYDQVDPELPKREYSGWLKIVCAIEGGITASAEAHVFIDVVSNISDPHPEPTLTVGVIDPNVDYGDVQIGTFPGQVIFRIDANAWQVSMTVTASNLYKDGVPSSPSYIPVNTGTSSDGALVEPDEGNAMEGHGNLLRWLPGVVMLNGMDGVASETWDFESGQSGHFSQNVTVLLAYDQADPALPKGEYSGWVKIACEIGEGITACAEARVFLDVVSNIWVGVVTSNVDLGDVESGVFPGDLTFRVDANMQRICIWGVTATNLYKGGDPSSQYVIPLKNDSDGDGAVVQPTNANPVGGHGNVLRWNTAVSLNGMSALKSESREYESDQDGYFSQNVHVMLEYDQSNPGLPPGEYSGWVRIEDWVMPKELAGDAQAHVFVNVFAQENLSLELPNGGEILTAGSTCTLTWSSTGYIADVLIEYSTNSGAAWTAENNIPNTGTYEWLVPNIDSNQCLVRISDANDPSINDVSDAVFTIFRQPLVIYVDNDALNDPEPNNSDASDPREDGSPEHPFDAIQEAIDCAYDGDTVVVLPGTYTGTGNRDIDYKGKAIIVRSSDPNDPNVVAATVIDCEVAGRGFYFHSGEDANSVLGGLTVTRGFVEGGGWGWAENGGGVYCSGSSPRIINCTFRLNWGREGAGMYNSGSNPRVINCAFTGNYAYELSTGTGFGGGMANYYSSPILINCTFTGNYAEDHNDSRGIGAGIYNYYSSPTLINCAFVENVANGNSEGGVISNSDSNPILTNCTFCGNRGQITGGITNDGSSSPILTNCILWGNSHTNGTQIHNDNDLANPTVTYSDIQGGYSGTGNINADPSLVDANSGDYHLRPDSPCIDAGDPNYIAGPNEIDLDGNQRVIGGRIDMGAYEYVPSSNDLPDLKVTSEDIMFGAIPGVPGEPNTISGTIHNIGRVTAENVEVVFKDFDQIIGTSVIPSILAADSNTVSIEHTWSDAGFRLITATADPYGDISESDETNNCASKLYQVGDVGDMNAAIEVSCSSIQAEYAEGSTANISGEAFYRIEILGEPDYVLPVKGGSVSVEVVDSNGVPQLTRYGFTDADGRFSTSFPVPGGAGDCFDVNVAVTDVSLEGAWEGGFCVRGPEPKRDLWVNQTTFADSAPDIFIEADIYAGSDNSATEPNVPVSFYFHPPQSGSQIGSTQYIPEMEPADTNTVSINWSNAPDGLYCIEATLGPAYSDDNNANNAATRALAVGPEPNHIDVVIEIPSDAYASGATDVNVLVTDDNGNTMIPCLLETLVLDINGVDERHVDLKPYFDWDAMRYVYPWQPPSDANGVACLKVTARSVEIEVMGEAITGEGSACVGVADDAPPNFSISASPYWAKIGQSVWITINASEPLLGDGLDWITVKDSADQNIPYSPVDPCHPTSTRWIYQTDPLPESTAFGKATIEAAGRDPLLQAGLGQGQFYVVEYIPDFWVHSEDIAFSDEEPNLGDTIAISAIIHASPDNTVTASDVTVTFYARHSAGDYKIGETQHAGEMPPGGSDSVYVLWTNTAEGWYVIEVELGPEFSDRDASNNRATRALPVGFECGLVCDLNCDGTVDFKDIGRLAMAWLESGSIADIYPPPPNGDDIVDFHDFAQCAYHWLSGL